MELLSGESARDTPISGIPFGLLAGPSSGDSSKSPAVMEARVSARCLGLPFRHTAQIPLMRWDGPPADAEHEREGARKGVPISLSADSCFSHTCSFTARE